MLSRFPTPQMAALAVALAVYPVSIGSLAHAQEPSSPSAQLEPLMRSISGAKYLSQVAISPDARRLAWGENGRLMVAPVDDLAKPLEVTASSAPEHRCREYDPIWAPDSASLAFFSDCGSTDGQADLYLSRLDGSAPRRLTALHGYVNSPAFSPDGSKIAFLYVEGATRPAGALAAMKPPSGVIGEEGIEVQCIAFARVGVTEPGKPDLLAPAGRHIYEFDWSPDSKSVAYIAAEAPGENNWWTAKLYTQAVPDITVQVNPAETPHAILDPVTVPGPLHGLQIAVPRWSPDGKSIAFIGGLMSDQGSTGGDLYVVPATGGRPRSYADPHATVSWFHWETQGNPEAKGDEHIDLTEVRSGKVVLAPALDVASGARAAGAEGTAEFKGTIGDGRLELSQSVARDGEEAFILSSFSDPPEIWMMDGGKPKQLTHFNDAIMSFWGPTDSIEWNNEGFHIQGWLMLPRNYDPAKKYPLIVEVHGGPAAAEMSRFGARGPLSPEAFSALGYFVLMPNPRGSFGEGEAFTEANRKDFGYGDLRDILAGVDTVLAKYPIDPNRVGITGWSYGGFMTMFAVTQTNRFRAAVAGAGISDWLSYYGENSIDEWMIPYFGASVYDDPAAYAKSSAIDFIKKVTTPTLSVVGDRDGECPAPQSFEFWHALRDLHVPAELVVYPNEGHGFVNPDHRRDVLDRTVNWFARYMPPGDGEGVKK